MDLFQKQVTFTPRLLIADLKGSLGYLNEQGSLYDTEPSDNQPLWDNTKLEITNAKPNLKTPFMQSLDKLDKTASEAFNFEEDVKLWVDYLLPLFHPRTVTVIKEYSHNCTHQPFNIFTCGRDLWTVEQFSDNFTDKIRSYVEECDLMQGFQVKNLYTIAPNPY